MHMRRVTIIAWGSRGDVGPAIDAAARLARGGRVRVTVAVSVDFVEWIRTRFPMLAVVPIPCNLEHLLASPASADAIVRNGDPIQFFYACKQLDDDMGMVDAIRAACEGADLIVCGFVWREMAYAIAHTLRVPVAFMFPMPSHASAYLPPTMYAGGVQPAPEECLQLHDSIYRSMYDRSHCQILAWYKHLGSSAPFASYDEYARLMRAVPTFDFFSPTVVPRPLDWPATAEIAGFIFPDLNDLPELAPDLEAWLDHGPPPIYVGFGSMPVQSTHALAPFVSGIIAHAPPEWRLVVFVGGMNPQDVSVPADATSEFHVEETSRVKLVRSVPHLRLFPRCAALVHHCGAGTTAAALWSGTPSVPVPVCFEQPFWADRMHHLGCAAQPTPFQHAQPRQVVERIHEALTLTEQAQRIATQIRSERGAERFVEWASRLLAEPSCKVDKVLDPAPAVALNSSSELAIASSEG